MPSRLGRSSGSARDFTFWTQARQESNLQPPVLERNPSNAGVAAFVDFQRLSSKPATPALLDNAGVGTNPGTEDADLSFPIILSSSGAVMDGMHRAPKAQTQA